MTTRTRRALYRVRNHARSLVRAVDALGPRDTEELSFLTALIIAAGQRAARRVSDRLTSTLDDGGDETVRRVHPKAPTLAEVGDYRRDDQADEARDVAREMAAREDA